MNGEEFEEELYRENLYFVYEDKCKELEKELENLKKIEKEHQQINGELREENNRLYKELKIKTDFIEELLKIILVARDYELYEKCEVRAKLYEEKLQELKGSEE